MVYFFTVIFIIILDLLSKKIVKRNFPIFYKKEIVRNKLYIWHIKNKGVAYNTFERFPNFILCFTGTAIGAILIYLISIVKKADMKCFKFSVAMILGGALGNFIDRLKNKCVTDFLFIKKRNAPIFNIADIFVLFGGLLSLISSIFVKE